HLLEGGLLLALTIYWLRRTDSSSSAIAAIAVAATIAAVANLVTVVPVLRGADSIRSLGTRLLTSRISGDVGAVSAAASYFAMACLVARALYESRRQALAQRRAWALGAAVLFIALWLTGSRTAVVCFVALIGLLIAARSSTWRERPLWPLAVGVVVIVIAAALVVGLDPRSVAGRDLERSFESRAAFLTTGLRMIGSA